MMAELKISRNSENMPLYHGSDIRIEEPDLSMSEFGRDFGRGFYLTTDIKQARGWAKIKANDNYSLTHTPYVNVYRLTDFKGLRVREFQDANKNWVDFILKNRKTNIAHTEYDVIIGKVADDNTRKMIAEYERGAFKAEAKLLGISEKDVLITKLHPERLSDQICICTEAAKKRISFVKGSVLR